ncbi:hypothetical protein H2200_002538 [Cladophialophora chaetospira]|uniref:Uncharacterized protein n=1 Tax=Cladophialophora chaetospira TaxID=386627 RepID=A0AA38XJ27_9EURO|nr:hypothetical protein H2200_002538 [Cladophialophora chaetospira]
MGEGVPHQSASPTWTSHLPNSRHVELFKNTDWAATDLGPLDRWGPDLRFAANMVFADSRGACVYWGQHRVAFYNESFMPMAGSAHPFLMGKPFAVGFPELEPGIAPIFDKAEADGMTVDVQNIPLFTERNGYLEETFFIGQFIPLRAESGKVGGFYNTVYESTFRVLHDRRRAVLDLITILPSSSTSSVFQHVVEALATNGNDLPMVLLYSADDERPGTCRLRLEGSIGVPQGHEIAPTQAEFHSSKDGLIPLFREARASDIPLVTRTTDQHYQQSNGMLLEGIQWAGFGEPSKDIVVAPLATVSRLFGLLVLGTNPRRTFDSSYQQFISDLTQQLLAKLNSAISSEEAKSREIALQRDLAESENRIRYMAQHTEIGLAHLTMEGTLVWANEQYYKVLGISKEEGTKSFSFLDAYDKDSEQQARLLWAQLLEGAPSVSGELRLQRLFVPPSGPAEPACVLANGFPWKEHGEIKYIMGCFTDVSHLKWAESVQIRSAGAARDAKRQQELFIDTTSHELRNPLGAIMQCAESIASSLQFSGSMAAADMLGVLRENVETAEIILACTSHQKRIIDDVLLLSRLESQMLSITPIQTNIDLVIADVLKMFKGECKQNGIALNIKPHQSLTDCKVDSVMCDPSRLMQIIINILANAIKYVRQEIHREILFTYGAAESVAEVYRSNLGVRWWTQSKEREDLTLANEWGDAQPLFLFFAVHDSGPGLAPQEIDRLFQRFVQTTKLTHVKYGGAGLGLYISRELTEKQGGEIGVASSPGEGATFAFYIKARRSETLNQSHRPFQLRSRSISNGKKITGLTAAHQLHVLLTEDNLINQKFLARGLEKHGYIVHVANHGLEALDILKKSACWKGHKHRTPVHMILMDWEMPILDGLATAKQIRELEEQGSIIQRIPIIAITANAREEQQKAALDAGMDDVLPKPFLVSEMVTKIQEWISKDANA